MKWPLDNPAFDTQPVIADLFAYMCCECGAQYFLIDFGRGFLLFQPVFVLDLFSLKRLSQRRRSAIHIRVAVKIWAVYNDDFLCLFYIYIITYHAFF